MVCTYDTCPVRVPPLWGCAGSRQARKRPPPQAVSWCTRPTAAPVPCRSVGVLTSSAGRKACAGRLQIGKQTKKLQNQKKKSSLRRGFTASATASASAPASGQWPENRRWGQSGRSYGPCFSHRSPSPRDLLTPQIFLSSADSPFSLDSFPSRFLVK